MKNIFLILFFIYSCHVLAAQIQEPLTYQAVVRNSAGEIVASKTVYFRLSILMENLQGLWFTVNFRKSLLIRKECLASDREGTEKVGDFNTIPWDTDKFFLKVEIDIGGQPFVEMVTTQLLVVPFTSPVKQSKRASATIEEDELMIIRKYVGHISITAIPVLKTTEAPTWYGSRHQWKRSMAKYPPTAEVVNSPSEKISIWKGFFIPGGNLRILDLPGWK